MNEEIPKPKKKFKGFSSIFQKPPKKNEKKEPPKKPFTGFSEFYKKIKDHEIYDEYDDYDSLYDPFVPRRQPQKPIEKVEEPPPPVDKHFKPQKYFDWCKQQSREAFDRFAEEEGCVPNDDENDEYERAASITANNLVIGIKNSYADRKYENDRKNYDQNEDSLSQTSTDINPWFNKMLNKWQKGDTPNENPVIQVPEIDHGLRNLFEKLNARETLFDYHYSRNVNTYPLEFQFGLLNKRMENFLERTKRSEILDDDKSEKSSSSGLQNLRLCESHTELPCQKKELQDYFNKLTKPKTDVDFTLEDFKSWYTKMSFKYDRRFKDFGETKITPEQGDFDTWLTKNYEKLNQKYNDEFTKAKKDLKPTPKRCRNRNTPKDGLQNSLNEDFSFDLSRCNWSTSNVSSCKSMIERLK